MATVPLTDAELIEQAQAFAQQITPERWRWEYVLSASHYRWKRQSNGVVELNPNARSMPVAAKIVGRRKYWVESALRRLRRVGYDQAVADEAERLTKYPESVLPRVFDVGPLAAWNVGHVYFARVVDYPHVVKIGFSRRVRERLEDIEGANKTRLTVLPGQLKVGTLLNEHWWHRDWQKFNIAGEWFFDPFMTERDLPAFLQTMKAVA